MAHTLTRPFWIVAIAMFAGATGCATAHEAALVTHTLPAESLARLTTSSSVCSVTEPARVVADEAMPSGAEAVRWQRTTAVSGDVVLVAWQASSNESRDAREILVSRRSPAGWLGAPLTVVHATPGRDAIAPSLAGLSGGRFLLTYSEGDDTERQLRAQVLDASGAPMGPSLRLSPDSLEPMHGAKAVLSRNDSGFVTFWASDGERYEMFSAAIACTTADHGELDASK